MKIFLKCGDIMFDLNLVQSVRKEYNTSCIMTFENGIAQQIEASYENICEKIEKAISQNKEISFVVLDFSTKKKRGEQYGL